MFPVWTLFCGAAQNPQLLVTTTPKRTEITRDLLELISPENIIRGSIYENTALSKTVLDDLRTRYEGRAGRRPGTARQIHRGSARRSCQEANG